MYTVNGEVVLDLNGKTLNGGGSDDDEMFYVTGAMTVIDSVGGGKIVYGGAAGMFAAEGDLAIGAATGDMGVSIDGVLFVEESEGDLIRANVKVDGNTEDDKLVWSVKPGSKCATEPVNGYWVVAPQGGSEPTQVAVPTALIGIMYDGTLKTGVVENVAYTLTGNTGTDAGEYEATATLAAGYIWSDNTTADKKIAWGILPNNSAEVVVTLASEIAEYTAQLEFPTATATIGGDTVAGNTAWDPATISEPEAGATNTYTVTFTVTAANYAGSTGTATFKVWKAAGGGSEDWPENPSTVSGQTAQAAFGITGDLANADAAALATWAKAKGVTYADRTTAILTDAFLLDCANTQEAIDEAAANFKITSISVAGDTVTIAPADGSDVGNGKVVIEGTATLSPISWHAKQAGDHFFKATLVVKPVTP